MPTFEILHGDSLDVMSLTMADNSVDAIVCDPPYGLSFMNRHWDYDVPSVALWAECLRVLKPGGRLLAFSGSRTYHRMTVAIEDAGFEITDQIMWVYGTGFPKSLDVSKAIDSRKDWAALKSLQSKVRAAREALGISQSEAARRMGLIGPDETLGGGGFMWFETGMRVPTSEQYPKLKAALALDGACDAAFEAAEREVMAQKRGGLLAVAPGQDNDRSATTLDITAPATEAARQWAGWGTALKPAHEPICVARKPLIGTVAENVLAWGTGAINVAGCRVATEGEKITPNIRDTSACSDGWNRPWMADKGKDASRQERAYAAMASAGRWPANLIHDGLTEEWARFFYCAKASKSDRGGSNVHPTVKPTDLMRYLCRLVTPPGGTVLDPFCGSGSTGKAAMLEGFNFIGIEREAEYVDIALARVAHAAGVGELV